MNSYSRCTSSVYGIRSALVALILSPGSHTIAAESSLQSNRTHLQIRTGSRLQTPDSKGQPALTIIDRDDLLRSGAVSVADYLRSTPFNSFGSYRPQSGSTAQPWAELSLHGLGAGRTLILIDGRRAPIVPSVGFGQDLNAIPLAAVERIEILPQGAAARYGSDAIGGVVNIVTRSDFNGVELSVGASSPTREGGETEQGSVLMGSSSDRGRLVAGASYANRGIVFQRDRAWSTSGASTFSNNFLNATLAPGSTHGYVPGGFIANPNLGAVVPGGCDDPGFSVSGTGASARCRYDFTLEAAHEVELRQSALFARASYAIADDWSAYLNARVSRVESLGRIAPALSSPWPGGAPFIPVGSPNHPAVRFPGRGYDPARPVFLRHRFAALGTRDTTSDATDYDLETGFQGQIGAIDVAIGGRFVESKYLELGRNFVVSGIAQQLIANGSYNIYEPFSNLRGVLDSLSATIHREAGYRAEELHAAANLKLFEMSGGTANLALGAEYRVESFADTFDTLQRNFAQIAGVPLANSAASRDIGALFADLQLPVFERLRVDLSARHDDYSDVGSETSGQLRLRFSPLDNLLLHASYGGGFSAPSLALQGIEPVTAVDVITNRYACFDFPAICQIQIPAYIIANPDLQSESTRQASIGLEWTATPWLDLTLSYFNIELDDRIRMLSSSLIIDCLLGRGTRCPPGLSALPPELMSALPHLGLGVGRSPGSGEIQYVQRGYANLGSVDVSGADLGVRTHFDFGAIGEISNRLTLSFIHSFKTDGIESVDLPSHPRLRAKFANTWTLSDVEFAWNINHIDGTQSTAAMFDDSDYPARLASWTTHDLQASWNAPWDGIVTLGINNIADRDPVLDPYDPTGRGYDFALYDGDGRMPYFRYRQVF